MGYNTYLLLNYCNLSFLVSCGINVKQVRGLIQYNNYIEKLTY